MSCVTNPATLAAEPETLPICPVSAPDVANARNRALVPDTPEPWPARTPLVANALNRVAEPAAVEPCPVSAPDVSWLTTGVPYWQNLLSLPQRQEAHQWWRGQL